MTAKNFNRKRFPKTRTVRKAPPPPRSESDVLADLRSLTQSEGFVHAYAFLAFTSTVITAGEEFTKDDFLKRYRPEVLIRTELALLQSLMISGPTSLVMPSPDRLSEMIYKAQELLEELHQSILQPSHQVFKQAFSELIEGNTPTVDPTKSGQSLREAFFYGAESAFTFQYLDFAEIRYKDDSKWLTSHVGFDASTAVEVLKAVRDVTTSKLMAEIERQRSQPASEFSYLPLFSFQIKDIVGYSGLDVELVTRVIETFTTPDNNPSARMDEVHKHNIVNSHPICKLSNGTYYTFLEYSLTESIYDCPFYWIAKDKKYFSKHSQSRGKFVEDLIAAKLIAIFGDRRVYKNVIFRDGKGHDTAEADVLVQFGRRIFIFQAKSKKLTETSRSGNDNAIISDFTRAVQSAYDQAVACATAMHEGHGAFVNGVQIDGINIGPSTRFYPISVVSEHYPALSHQSRLFLELSENEIIRKPLVFDIFTVDVIAEMLDTPLYFVDYLCKRSDYFELVLCNHELVALSFYITRNLFFDDVRMVYLHDDFLVDLDLAMAVRRLGIPGPATPPGQLTRFSGTEIQTVLDAVNASNQPEAHLLGEFLISLSGDAANQFNTFVEKAKNLGKLDNTHHDFSLSAGKAGITVYCHALPGDGLERRLFSHCAMRKYVSEADNWFGLAIHPTGLPFLMLGITEPWHFDPDLNAFAGDFRVSGRMSSADPADRKIKVNEKCPCGSGKKYKKCHGSR